MTLVMIFIGIAIFWAACGVIHYGLCFGYFQREYGDSAAKDYDEDRRFALGLAPFGPIALIATLQQVGVRHGFKWR